MSKLVLIDGNSLLFRAFYATAATGNVMRTKAGVPTNGIYGLAKMTFKILEIEKPDYVLCAFDTDQPTFRHLQYDDYKAGRKAPPIELIPQFALARELFNKLGIFVSEIVGYEADDIIGNVSKIGTEKNLEVVIYSSDKDLLQLINQNVKVVAPKTGISEVKIYTAESFLEEYGFSSEKMTDYKGLMGDTSDNIKGIPGIGEKTAKKLLIEYGNLENILEAKIPGKMGENIINGRESGIKSKQLATIIKDFPLNFTFESLKYNGYDKNNIVEFIDEYEMHSLKNYLKKENEIIVEKIEEEISYKIIENEIDLNNYQTFLLHFDAANPFQANLLGCCFANSEEVIYIPISNLIDSKSFKEYLTDVSKATFDVKKVLSYFKYHNINVDGLDFDYALACYILDSENNNPNKQFTFLNIVSSKSDIELLAYQCFNLHKKLSYLKSQLIEKNVDSLYYDLELPLCDVLSDMEVQGICLDLVTLEEMSKQNTLKLNNLTSEIYKYAGKEFNINSPTQLKKVLFDDLGIQNNKKDSTSIDILEDIYDQHEIVPLLISYRKYAKLQSAYLNGLPNSLYSDNKLHTLFNNMVTQTGRLSSSEPNLQNISIRDLETMELRKCLIPSSNKSIFLSLDYSQIELRVIAGLAKEENMLNSFINDIDIHRTTAALIYGKTPEEVSSEERSHAKTINFGIIYGMSDWGLADTLHISRSQAHKFIEEYFAKFPKIKQYQDNLLIECQKNNYVTTILNRRRYINSINSPIKSLVQVAKRLVINTPIQGSASDIIKIAMLDITKKLLSNNLKSKLVIQIHDELIFEIVDDELMLVLDIAVTSMENAYLELGVPLKVSYGYGKTLYEVK
jgi:DNA polymerase-1